jgi:hypothetical protein
MTNWEIYGNTFHDNFSYAISSAQQELHCSSELIYNNVFYNNDYAPPWNQSTVDLCGDANSVFYGNTMYNNTASGSNKSGGVSGGASKIVNNVFYNNGLNGYGSIAATSGITGGQNNGTPDHNYISGASQLTGTNVISTCYATGNCPGFANIATHAFQLLAGSPALRAGLTIGSPYDFDILNIARVTPWDLGAYSRGGVVTAPLAPTHLRIVR